MRPGQGAPQASEEGRRRGAYTDLRHTALRLEHRHEPLLPVAAYYARLAWHGLLALGLVALALGIGILGYRGFEHMPWVDALLNAAMILGGMGPVGELHTEGGKVFAACYALFSGLAFIVIMGVLFAPVVHRFLHRFHLSAHPDEDGDGDK